MEKLQTEKCQAIMQATLRLVATQGFHGTPTSQIAGSAGVGVGSIYRYFKDKDELIHAVHAQLEAKMHLALAEQLNLELPDRELFIVLICSLINHLLQNPLEFKFLEQYYNSPFGIEKMREKFLVDELPNSDVSKPFLNILFGGKGKTVKDLPKPIIHSLAFGPVIFIIRDHLAGLIELNDGLIQNLAEGCWDAIKI
ncbi:MAG TPA: TetR/AcrR family transcriptional regulator [Malonomonas sp.]